MKRKAISRKIAVKNESFIAALISAVRERDKIHQAVADQAEKSGILTKLALTSKKAG